MKPSYGLYFVLLATLLLSSCSKNETLFTIDTFMDMTLIAGTSTQTVWGYEEKVVFPYSVQLAAFNTEEKNIMSINSSYGLVYPRNNAGINLSFINEMVVNVLNPDDLTERGKEAFYYTQENFNRLTQIELFPSLPDIKDYIKDDRIVLQVEFIFNSPPPATFDLAFELEFGAIEIDEP